MPVRLTPTVKAIAILCFVAFLVQQTADQFFGGNVLAWLGLVPAAVVNHFRVWQLVTYAFIHGEVMHLFFNLLMLVFIGSELEGIWGRARFIRFYLFCAVSAAVAYLLLQLVASGGDALYQPMVGASGAIYGLLMAYGLIFGERVLLFMMLFPMKAKHFVWILAGIEFLSSIYSGRSGLASIAHLGGMVAGFGYLWGRATWAIAKRRRAERQETAKKSRRRRAAQHLKLVINRDKTVGLKSSENPDDDDDLDDNPKTWH
jgi:membrane associated rhomboid family serine protease